MKVSVYSTTTCPYCVMVKKWLQDKNVEFEDILVDCDPQAAQKMIKLSGQMGVPFTWIQDDDNEESEGQGVLGYDIATLGHLLKVS
ncbi:hypothetical protein EOL96_00725 [Candidatus Saccharibacteria bacterium]|nr:hypothetical protein [Candidatus Saccharibacteria bacterium]